MSFVNQAGVRIVPFPSRTSRLSSQEIRQRRYASWLAAYEGEHPDPVTGRPAPQPLWLIAAIAGVDESTVSRGIAAARRTREVVDECREGAG